MSGERIPAPDTTSAELGTVMGMRIRDFIPRLGWKRRAPPGADAPHPAPAEAPVAKTRRRLFTKYVALFVAVVCVALLSNGIFDVFFYYQEHKASLIRIQREQAEAAAAKIGQFIKEIESQLGWTTQLPWSAGSIEQRRFDALRLLRQVPAITELAQLDATGKERCGCRGWPWTWSAAAPISPRIRSSPRRWRTRSITARSISAANPSPT